MHPVFGGCMEKMLRTIVEFRWRSARHRDLSSFASAGAETDSGLNLATQRCFLLLRHGEEAQSASAQ